MGKECGRNGWKGNMPAGNNKKKKELQPDTEAMQRHRREKAHGQHRKIKLHVVGYGFC